MRLIKLSVFGALLAQLAILPAHASDTGSRKFENTPLDIVMLVDESASLSNADVAREIQAAGTIAQAPLNPRSRITIVGFGGDNGLASHQDPVNVACQPTVTGGKFQLNYLANCVHKLHRRSERQGDDTDYAAALAQAMFYLGPNTAAGRQSPKGATKAIFLMTDGALDVHRDPTYTRTGNWQAAAHHAVNLQLASARAAGVEVWTLGFGSISAPAGSYLKYLAANGAQKACDTRSASKPRSIVVTDSTAALDALNSLYAAASCSGQTHTQRVPLSGGQTRVLTVNIPAIANAGEISVDKVTPNIRVNYQTPSGEQVSGSPIGAMTFERSGQGTAVDVLHVANPEPGPWKVTLVAPPGLKSQLVSATAFWQGAIRAVVFASPSSARTGQDIALTLSVLGPNGPITQLSEIQGVQATVTVTGDGIVTPEKVPVSNSGEGSATPTGVADFKGTFKAPSTAGTLVFTGTVVGYGLHATQVPQEVQVGGPPDQLQCTVTFSAPATITAGQSVSGQVLCQNETGQNSQVLLTLATTHALASISPSGVINTPSGNSQTNFQLGFGSDSPPGSALVQVKVVDAANSATVYGNGQLQISVMPPPSLVAKYRWEILAALLLLVLGVAALLIRRSARRAAADVQGLSAVLKSDDDSIEINALRAPNRRSDTFRFMLREADGRNRLATPQSNEGVYVASRDLRRNRRTGTVTVVTPEKSTIRLRIGGSSDELPAGGRLAFREIQKSAPAKPSFNGAKPTGTGTASTPNLSSTSASSTSDNASKEIWR
jgi:hypothetical protein